MPSASELLNSIQETIGLKKKKPPEALAAAGTLPIAPAETPAAPEMPVAPLPAPVLEPAPAMVSPEPPAQEPAPAGELPDWLSPSAPAVAEPVPAPEPEAPVAVEVPEAPPVLPVAEAPVSPPEAKVEDDPFVISREFNVYMETIRQAQAVLASGIALTPEEQKKALIAVARSNSLLSKLPSEVFKSVLLMRAVAANNPKFGRDDFQLEMLTAMDVIKAGLATKG